MSPSQEEKIQEVIEKSGLLALISEEGAGEEILLAKEALKIILEDKGLKVCQFPERTKELENKWSFILPTGEDNHFLYSTSILIPKNKINIQEISYSDDDEHVGVNIDSKNKAVAKEDVIFKPHPIAFDAAIYFASNDNSISEECLTRLAEKTILPKKEEIITIAPDYETIAEKVFNIFGVIEPQAAMDNTLIPHLLLASLLIETNNFEEWTKEGTLDTASALLKMGADKEAIDQSLGEEGGESFVRILGRAMARTFINKPLKSVWTFISSNDLEKTGNEKPSAAMLYRIIRKISRLTKPQFVFVLLWQAGESVSAAIKANDNQKDLSGKIKNFLEAKEDGGFLLCGPYKNFSEAEIKIQETLKKVV